MIKYFCIRVLIWLCESCYTSHHVHNITLKKIKNNKPLPTNAIPPKTYIIGKYYIEFRTNETLVIVFIRKKTCEISKYGAISQTLNLLYQNACHVFTTPKIEVIVM